MKKLIILFLVLAMCSTVSAVLTYEFFVTPEMGDTYVWDGGGIKASDIITVKFMETGTNLGFAGLSITGDGDYMEDSLVWQAAAFGGFSVVSKAGQYTISGQVLYFPGTQAVNPILTWEFHIPDVPDSTWFEIDITQGLYGGQSIVGPLLDMHVPIPEPMTIMLLGLGALMLRRKR
ncbi:MAG: PEP-CTERM sorting domain-containing protein [Planctomycetota bacterium]|jgi:hypothetical protein